MDGEYRFTEQFEVTPDIKEKFDDIGYILVRELLNKNELTKLKVALEGDEGVMTKAYNIGDSKHDNTRLCVWNHPGNDITGMLGRSEKIVTTMEQILGGEVYHYHTKLMMKEANGGGKFLWHQDYGYWYHNGCIFPDMGSVFVAVDKCVKSNGCLQVLPGSHKLGRVDHKKISGQMGIDPERLKHIWEHFKTIHVELEPGDALFFHCNLLHKSDDNNSPNRRWAFVMAYNRSSNNPVIKHHHPRYVKLHKVPNTAIQECNSTTDLTDKGFIQQTGTASDFIVEDDHLN